MKQKHSREKYTEPSVLLVWLQKSDVIATSPVGAGGNLGGSSGEDDGGWAVKPT